MTAEGMIEFLLARIAEDEAEDMRYDPLDHWWLPSAAEPRRLRAECEAKRRIVEQAEEASMDRHAAIADFCVGQAERDAAYASDPGSLILKALAAVYADHPDYRQEWKS
jgi:hypothetical protein